MIYSDSDVISFQIEFNSHFSIIRKFSLIWKLLHSLFLPVYSHCKLGNVYMGRKEKEMFGI